MIGTEKYQLYKSSNYYTIIHKKKIEKFNNQTCRNMADEEYEFKKLIIQ